MNHRDTMDKYDGDDYNKIEEYCEKNRLNGEELVNPLSFEKKSYEFFKGEMSKQKIKGSNTDEYYKACYIKAFRYLSRMDAFKTEFKIKLEKSKEWTTDTGSTNKPQPSKKGRKAIDDARAWKSREKKRQEQLRLETEEAAQKQKAEKDAEERRRKEAEQAQKDTQNEADARRREEEEARKKLVEARKLMEAKKREEMEREAERRQIMEATEALKKREQEVENREDDVEQLDKWKNLYNPDEVEAFKIELQDLFSKMTLQNDKTVKKVQDDIRKRIDNGTLKNMKLVSL